MAHEKFLSAAVAGAKEFLSGKKMPACRVPSARPLIKERNKLEGNPYGFDKSVSAFYGPYEISFALIATQAMICFLAPVINVN